jgi:hypothetical protein
VHIDRPIEHELVDPIDRVHELVARQDAPTRLEQRCEEAELGRGQRDGPPADCDIVAGPIHDEVAVLEHAFAGRSALPDPLEDAPDADDQLGR